MVVRKQKDTTGQNDTYGYGCILIIIAGSGQKPSYALSTRKAFGCRQCWQQLGRFHLQFMRSQTYRTSFGAHHNLSNFLSPANLPVSRDSFYLPEIIVYLDFPPVFSFSFFLSTFFTLQIDSSFQFPHKNRIAVNLFFVFFGTFIALSLKAIRMTITLFWVIRL